MSSSSTHCVDASIVVRLVTAAGPSPVRSLWETWQVERPRLVAPTLMSYEVVNALHRAVRLDAMTGEVATRALTASLALPVELHGDRALHERALTLAGQLGLSATYDAHYLAVAERFGVPVWTTDARLAKAVGAGPPMVRLVE